MTTPQPEDLGGFYYGEYAVFALTFARSGTNQNPGAGPFFKATPPGVGSVEVDYSSQITPLGSGAYQFVPVTNIPGDWTGRIYSTGAGQTSRDVVWVVAPTQNP